VANDPIGEGNFDASAENKAAGNAATAAAEAPSKKKKKGTSKKAKSVKEKLAIVDGA